MKKLLLCVGMLLLSTISSEGHNHGDVRYLGPHIHSHLNSSYNWLSTHPDIHHKAHHKRYTRHKYHGSPHIANPVGPIITVPTAAKINIQVAAPLANKFAGFIQDLVDIEGYVPKQIHCYASGGHVTYSRHYVGAACDFDQRGWGLTAPTMHHVSRLAHKWGLRDGCDFTDCGHIDDGRTPRQGQKELAKHWPLRYDEIKQGG